LHWRKKHINTEKVNSQKQRWKETQRTGERDGVLGWGSMLQARRLRVRLLMRSLNFLFKFT
jgi:hypothetical protein